MPKKPCRRKRAGGSESTADATGAGCGGESSVSAGGSGLDGGCGGGAATVEAGDGACPAIGSQLSSEKQVQKKTEKNRERKARKKASRQEKAKIQLDVEMEQLLYSKIDPTSGKVDKVQLMDYLESEATKMYPNIGQRTWRVPHAYINAGKESEEFISNYKPPQDNDHRSDRAESFFGDCMFYLSEQVFLHSAVGPFFIITSYEYQHYLSRLKDYFHNKPEQMEGLAGEILHSADTTVAGDPISSPATSGDDTATATTASTKPKEKKGRGEIDMLVLCRNQVVFCEVKAVGDNFGEHENCVNSVIDKLWAIRRQLRDDLRVFSHVMRNVLTSPGEEGSGGAGQGGGIGDRLRKSFVAVLPNLEESYVAQSFERDQDLEDAYKDMGIKILTKESMPKERYNILGDLGRFQQWWMHNVFDYACQDGKLLRRGLEHLTLRDVGETSDVESEMLPGRPDEGVKVMQRIVGRYLGLLSVVQVSKTTKLSRNHVEARSAGQMIWYIGKRFSDIVLTPAQREHVEQPHLLGYLHGPPGSGKTVVLAVRARKWILNDQNFVVIINMYRGCPKGRVIGRHMYNIVTQNVIDNVQEDLKSSCLEFPADVDAFSAEDFQRLKTTIHDQFGADLGQNGSRLLFIVDETYVQDYWNSVYKPLRDNFKASSMWCAGLFGKEPEGFTAFELNKVMRCPPAIQRVLSLIDWVEARKKCYSQNSVDAQVASDGAHAITIRHHLGQFSRVHPSQSRECGAELASLLEQLDVEKPASPHERDDLKEWTLRCSDILILVGMPRWLFRFHKPAYLENQPNHPGFLDTTISRYRKYMQCYQNCPLLQELEARGYPVKVHTDLSCPGMLAAKFSSGRHVSLRSKGPPADTEQQPVINLTWVYTYQGMENKVIIFLPGDHAKPQGGAVPDWWTDPDLNIPCPGLDNDLRREGDSDSGSAFCKASEEEETCHTQLSTCSGEGTDGNHMDSSSDTDTDSEGLANEAFVDYPTRIKESEKYFQQADVDIYGRWDKNNLLIAGSRSTSLLVMVTCGKEPLHIEGLEHLQTENKADGRQ